MKTWLLAIPVIAVSLFPLTRAKADTWNQKTVFTFNAPVELPGIVIGPGTYVFKLLDSASDRNIVQVFNKNETKLYATILTVPDYRLRPSSKTIITFAERPGKSPEAVKEWFYPGDNYGQEFVYPHSRALELAQTTKQNVVEIPNEAAQNITKPATTAQAAPVVALKKAPLTAVNPQGSQVEIAQAATPKSAAAPAPATPSQPAATPVTTANNTTTTASNTTGSTPAELPKTASNLPLILLAGVMLIGISLGLRFVGKRAG